MIKELIRVSKARNWMKKNSPFLYSWHAYVGYELDLFAAFKKGATIEEVAHSHGIQRDLLRRWAEVGVSLKHLKEKGNNKYKTSSHKVKTLRQDNPKTVGVLLKEMMELHIPTLLEYPEYMKNRSRATFDHEKHGATVAETSALLEQFVFFKLKKLVKEHNLSSVLDVGCGTGGYLQRLAVAFPELAMLGVDLNEEVIETARARTHDEMKIKFMCADLQTFTPTDKIDLVLANNVLHYIEPTEREAFFSRLEGWLTSNGRIFMITPIYQSKHGKKFSNAFNSFFTAYDNLYPLPSLKTLEEFAQNNGLKVEKICPIIREGGWYYLVFKKAPR
ncbi:class I SAM-dependent methyltransferase [Bacillus tianshenii]|nr:class I SAM-dependent methyltransferase [Bacillus tianshenii]